VAVVSGKISGSTETATIFVEKQYEHFNVSGAYAAALVLAVLALMTLFAMNLIQRRDRKIVAPSVVAEPTLATAGENPGKEAPDGHQG
jgi:sulfate transport system permease protein